MLIYRLFFPLDGCSAAVCAHTACNYLCAGPLAVSTNWSNLSESHRKLKKKKGKEEKNCNRFQLLLLSLWTQEVRGGCTGLCTVTSCCVSPKTQQNLVSPLCCCCCCSVSVTFSVSPELTLNLSQLMRLPWFILAYAPGPSLRWAEVKSSEVKWSVWVDAGAHILCYLSVRSRCSQTAMRRSSIRSCPRSCCYGEWRFHHCTVSTSHIHPHSVSITFLFLLVCLASRFEFCRPTHQKKETLIYRFILMVMAYI